MLRATFLPEHHQGKREKMWLVIAHDPTLLTASVKDVVEPFRVKAACKDQDLNLIRQNENDILYEDKDGECYKHAFILSIGRIVRSSDSVSFLGYRTYVEDIPADERTAIIAYLNAAPFQSAAPKDAASNQPK